MNLADLVVLLHLADLVVQVGRAVRAALVACCSLLVSLDRPLVVAKDIRVMEAILASLALAKALAVLAAVVAA